MASQPARFFQTRWILGVFGVVGVCAMVGHTGSGWLGAIIKGRFYIGVWAGLSAGTSLLLALGLPYRRRLDRVIVAGFIGLMLFGAVPWIRIGFDATHWRERRAERWRMLPEISSTILWKGARREDVLKSLGDPDSYAIKEDGSIRDAYLLRQQRSDWLELRIDYDADERLIFWKRD